MIDRTERLVGVVRLVFVRVQLHGPLPQPRLHIADYDKALHNKDSLHIKQYTIMTVCI